MLFQFQTHAIQVHTAQPVSPSTRDRAALAALSAAASALCLTRLTRVAGTHGLLLDGLGMCVPKVAGVARWTVLQPSAAAGDWQGPLRAQTLELPFADDSFCAVLACFLDHADATDAVAAELARVLAPHGTLLLAGFHPHSLWRRGVLPGCWERWLRGAGLSVKPAVRCGAPWPRARGVAGMPAWLPRVAGGAYVVEARRSVLATLPLRQLTGRRAVEAGTWVPGAQRQCA